jgi:hypothetical protein
VNDMTTNLATYSVVLTYSAMAVYVVAFISFALDMAKRSGDVTAAAKNAGADDRSADAASAAAAPGAKTVATRSQHRRRAVRPAAARSSSASAWR